LDCCCGARDFEPCSVCGCCINDECECTKQDRVIAEMQEDIRQLIEVCRKLEQLIPSQEDQLQTNLHKQKNVMSLYPTAKDVEDRYNARNEEEEID